MCSSSISSATSHESTAAGVRPACHQVPVFSLRGEPAYGGMPSRAWDVIDWYSDQSKTTTTLGWEARTDFREGLRRTADWYRELKDKHQYQRSSKQFTHDRARGVSAVVACYKDAQAIPILHERLQATFDKLKLDYEIIFVNDNSPDHSQEVIRLLSAQDRHVVGISHSRNFGSQAAFRSGMEIATKNACVLLDGDLQDPPELIEDFVAKWKEGFDVVYGRRVRREGPLFMRFAYKAFYRVFDALSYLSIPYDAGDFSLIDRRAVDAILQHPERDFFLRGIRASVGFKQAGVDYVRPERRFGRTTNSFLKNLGWAKKGILSFSYAPLLLLTFVGSCFLLLSILVGVGHVVLRVLSPGVAGNGGSTILVCVLFFGSLNLFGIAILGEYIAKIFEETKRRPPFIRNTIIRHGTARSASDSPTNQ